MFDWLVDRRQ